MAERAIGPRPDEEVRLGSLEGWPSNGDGRNGNGTTGSHAHRGGAASGPGTTLVEPHGEKDRPLDRRIVLLLATACGMVVANLYYAQPLLDTIAREFGTTTGTAGLAVTATQIGYATGLLLLVPLGDMLERRQLVTTVLLGTLVGLSIAALAPGIGLFVFAALLIGVTSVVVQILVPYSADLAGEAERGRVVGTVMSGLLIGVLASRIFSGLIAQLAGWRTVYWVGAILMVILSLVLRRLLPRSQPQSAMSYPALLRSLWPLLREEPVLRRRSLYGALGFAAFNSFWTSMAFLLARPPYGFSNGEIGLFGLVGVAGALAASFAGRLSDRGWQLASTGGFIVAALVSFGFIAAGASHLVPLVIGVVLLDLGIQGTQIMNQSEIYKLRPNARSRLTTVYMTSYFVGGGIGSASSAMVYGSVGWIGVSALGAGFMVMALLVWLTELPGATSS